MKPSDLDGRFIQLKQCLTLVDEKFSKLFFDTLLLAVVQVLMLDVLTKNVVNVTFMYTTTVSLW